MRGEYAKTLRSMGIRGFFARNGSTYLNARFRRPNIQTSEYGRPYRRIPHGGHLSSPLSRLPSSLASCCSPGRVSAHGGDHRQCDWLCPRRGSGRLSFSRPRSDFRRESAPHAPHATPHPRGAPFPGVPPGATPSMGGSHCSRAIPAANRGLTPYSLCHKRTSGFRDIFAVHYPLSPLERCSPSII